MPAALLTSIDLVPVRSSSQVELQNLLIWFYRTRGTPEPPANRGRFNELVGRWTAGTHRGPRKSPSSRARADRTVSQNIQCVRTSSSRARTTMWFAKCPFTNSWRGRTLTLRLMCRCLGCAASDLAGCVDDGVVDGGFGAAMAARCRRCRGPQRSASPSRPNTAPDGVTRTNPQRHLSRGESPFVRALRAFGSERSKTRRGLVPWAGVSARDTASAKRSTGIG
jgi:hypothetical protein